MKPESRNVIEGVGLLAIVLSLIFVGLELRQSTIASKAASYQALGIASAESWRLRAENQNINDSIRKVVATYPNPLESSLTPSELDTVRAFVVSVLRTHETAFLQVESGLLDEEALEYLGYEGFLNSNLFKALYPYVTNIMSVEFKNYIAEQTGISEL